jgi:hypothetical protein
VVRTGTYFVVIAIIAVKTLSAVLNTIVRTVTDLRESRRSSRA